MGAKHLQQAGQIYGRDSAGTTVKALHLSRSYERPHLIDRKGTFGQTRRWGILSNDCGIVLRRLKWRC